MSNYSKYTGEQIEVVLSKIGGVEVIDRLLRCEIELVEKKAEPVSAPKKMVTCTIENNRNCSICHTMFGDSADDVVCANKHMIGQQYEV